ncbi:hypothetical protein Tco_0319289 [Tanacetum coccineum]
MPSPRPATYSPKEVMYRYYHPHLTSGDGFDHELRKISSDESKVHIEVLSVLWGNRLPILNGSLPLSRSVRSRCCSLQKGQGNYRAMAQLPVSAQRHPWLRYEVLDFEGLTEEMVVSMDARLSMEHTDALGHVLGRARRQMSWRQFILAMGLHNAEEIATDSFRAYWDESSRIMDPLRRLCHRLITHTIAGRGQTPKKGATVVDQRGSRVSVTGTPEDVEGAPAVDEGV